MERDSPDSLSKPLMQITVLSPRISFSASVCLSDDTRLKNPEGHDGHAGKGDRKIGMPEDDTIVQRANRLL